MTLKFVVMVSVINGVQIPSACPLNDNTRSKSHRAVFTYITIKNDVIYNYERKDGLIIGNLITVTLEQTRRMIASTTQEN